MDSSVDKSTARLCGGGCGFFGSEANRGFCSKCYEDYLKLQIAKTVPSICQQPEVSDSEGVIDTISSQDLVSLTDAAKSCTIGAKRKCGCCNKKLGLLGFECRCGRSFCGSHRHAESHVCNFDYKAAGRAKIEKENPLCRGDKIRDRS